MAARHAARSRQRGRFRKSTEANDHVRLLRFRWAPLVGAVVAIAVIAGVFTHVIDMRNIQAYAQELNGGIAFGLLTILPLLGFPASVLHVAAGIRWGPWLGITLVSCSILLQLLASFAAVHLWRHRFRESAWLQRIRRRIPKGAHASICVLALLLPGAPFAGINYVLPLVGVPFRTYLLCCLPLHTLRATVTVSLGGESANFTPGRLVLLGVYVAALLGASWWTYARLRSRLGDPPSREGDQKQPA